MTAAHSLLQWKEHEPNISQLHWLQIFLIPSTLSSEASRNSISRSCRLIEIRADSSGIFLFLETFGLFCASKVYQRCISILFSVYFALSIKWEYVNEQRKPATSIFHKFVTVVNHQKVLNDGMFFSKAQLELLSSNKCSNMSWQPHLLLTFAFKKSKLQLKNILTLSTWSVMIIHILCICAQILLFLHHCYTNRYIVVPLKTLDAEISKHWHIVGFTSWPTIAGAENQSGGISYTFIDHFCGLLIEFYQLFPRTLSCPIWCQIPGFWTELFCFRRAVWALSWSNSKLVVGERGFRDGN